MGFNSAFKGLNPVLTLLLLDIVTLALVTQSIYAFYVMPTTAAIIAP
jgi:hypothetical protein